MSKLNYFNTRPKLTPINIPAYLQRIGLVKEQVSLGFLKKLQKHHLLSIPIENLDIHYGKKIQLDIKYIYDKVIEKKRGGLNLEVTVLMYHLLTQLGFSVILVPARPFSSSHLAEFAHMVLIVKIDAKKYLLDVGSQNLHLEPKSLNMQPQLDYTQYFKFDKDPDNNWILQKSSDNFQYRNIYSFKLQPAEIIQFYERLNYVQNDPRSFHFQNKFISKRTPQGLVTLTDSMLVLKVANEQKEYTISNEDEFLTRLSEYFGYDIQSLIRNTP